MTLGYELIREDYRGCANCVPWQIFWCLSKPCPLATILPIRETTLLFEELVFKMSLRLARRDPTIYLVVNLPGFLFHRSRLEARVFSSQLGAV